MFQKSLTGWDKGREVNMPSDMSYFNSICSLSKAFGKVQSRQKLLDLIVKSAIDTMKGKAACLFLYDEEKDTFVPAAEKGLSKNHLHQKPEKAGKQIKELVKNGYIAIKDATKDKKVDNHDLKKAEGIKSILTVPVMDNKDVVGVLVLYTDTLRTFSKDEISFMQALADQGGMAIERARLIGQLRNNTNLFHDLSTGINSTLNINEVMHKLTKGLAKSLKAKGVSISLIDEKSGDLRLIECHGLSDSYCDAGPITREKIIPVVLEGKTIIVDDAGADDGLSFHGQNKEEGVTTFLAAPIKTVHGIIGVMQLFYGYKRKFYDDEILMVNALAAQAGSAVQNAACYLTLENEMDELKNDIWSHRSWF